MKNKSWIPLHVHSQYSILDGTSSLEDLVQRAKELGLPALALTDQGNMFGAVEFYKACQSQGIKPIIGCELYLAPSSRLDKRKIPGIPAGFPLILLAKNKQGYQNLCQLTSIAHVEGFYYTPRIDKQVLEKHAEGLICLSGSVQGKLSYLILQGREAELIEEARWFASIFKDDFYLELQRHPMSEEAIIADGMDKEGWLLQNYRDYIRNQDVVTSRLYHLGKELGIRCVATNGSHYLHRTDWKAHEILMNIQSGEPCEIWERDSFGNPKSRVLNPKREVYFSHELYFKSPEEMSSLFADMPDALESTAEIADKISFQFDFKTRYYPVFTPPQGFSKEDYLKHLCEQGIHKRYTSSRLEKVETKYPGRDPLAVVKERLNYELGIIISKGMCDYILIVHDFIAWAKSKGIAMGPGRGSGVGSIILYLIEITDIEPLRFNLFFERFINPERLSYPDIDVDICMDRRNEVIEYTVQKYGKEKVAQIITFGTMKAKMAIKDVGRMLSMPLSKVNSIAKLIPEELGITLNKALDVDPALKQSYETDPEVKELIDIALKLEGSVRNTGVHAAGIIISGDPLTEHIPVCTAKDSDMLVTQYSMKPVELVGMLKIDFLGLKTLTSIQKTVEAIRLERGITIDWIDLPLDDERTFALLNHGKMLGIFQMESGGMQDLSKQLQIDKFEEIIAVVALYRPGPMEMIPAYINRKHGRELIEIDHPLMKDILAETYGIMVYQEQVMQIASLLANYSLGEGDVLRRAMGKKDREEMQNQREKFKQGALKNNIDEETSMRIFDKVEKFASYGFNKAHAAVYGYLAYVTAYLKANYPGEWMAALLTCDRDDITKVAKIIAECQAMNLPILSPDINESRHEFVAAPKGIRFAMGGIKGVGEGVVETIVAEREKTGPFKSLFDFCKRIDTKKVGKKVIETLIEAGCFDFTGWERAALILSVEPMYQISAKQQKEFERGVLDFFTSHEDTEDSPLASPPANAPSIPKRQLLRREKELLGFYLTGHPLDEFRSILSRLSCASLSQITDLPHDAVIRAAFIVEDVQVKTSNKTQKKFAILTISDGIERFELPIWADLYENKTFLFVDNQILYAVLQVDKKEETLKLNCRWVDDLTKASDEMIEACDKAYEEAKSYAKNSESRQRYINKKKETTPDMPKKIQLKLDANTTRLSHILQMKDLFRSFPGTTSIHLEFWTHTKKLGTIAIEGRWGISFNKEFEDRLKSFSSILKEVNHF
jgi:DNA polymerase-3 subunit alpha